METDRGRVVELFAGVGGFRLGLERAGWQVVWANQWEPSTRRQHAFDCYTANFPTGEHVCADIATVLDEVSAGVRDIPAHDLLVGGFPCPDYSVAKTRNQALGITGDKGALWWQIHRLLTMKRPSLVFLENVDRLLKSPSWQRGRDFAVILATLADLGYEVEWRVVNAADYGYPQKRRRVYLIGRRSETVRDANERLRDGPLARALPIDPESLPELLSPIPIEGDPSELTERFGSTRGDSPFLGAGLMSDRRVWTFDPRPRHDGPSQTLGDVLERTADVPSSAFVPSDQVATWRYLKGAKREQRIHKGSGTPYLYVEGTIPFPDRTDRPARTILTAEGGPTPSRFKHLIAAPDGRYRRLTPRELERLNGFPDDWTATGMPEGRRAFMMGNALVVGIVERIGRELIAELRPVGLVGAAARGTA